MNEVIVVLDNIRSLHNVGSILRTCDGFGVKKLIACGLTPYPEIDDDERLPHVKRRATKHIAKTALGAEEIVETAYFDDLELALTHLQLKNYKIWAIEQSRDSINLADVIELPQKLAIVLGNEVEGVTESSKIEKAIEIPMHGSKESFNVSVSAGIVLYHFSTL